MCRCDKYADIYGTFTSREPRRACAHTGVRLHGVHEFIAVRRVSRVRVLTPPVSETRTSVEFANGIRSQVEVNSNDQGRTAAVLFFLRGVCEAVQVSRDCATGNWVCLTFVYGYVYSPEFNERSGTCQKAVVKCCVVRFVFCCRIPDVQTTVQEVQQ